jgi:hypothetical protein
MGAGQHREGESSLSNTSDVDAARFVLSRIAVMIAGAVSEVMPTEPSAGLAEAVSSLVLSVVDDDETAESGTETAIPTSDEDGKWAPDEDDDPLAS